MNAINNATSSATACSQQLDDQPETSAVAANDNPQDETLVAQRMVSGSGGGMSNTAGLPPYNNGKNMTWVQTGKATGDAIRDSLGMRDQSSFVQVPGTSDTFVNPWNGEYFAIDHEGNIDIHRSGQNYNGSLERAVVQSEYQGGKASFNHLDWRIARVIQSQGGIIPH